MGVFCCPLSNSCVILTQVGVIWGRDTRAQTKGTGRAQQGCWGQNKLWEGTDDHHSTFAIVCIDSMPAHTVQDFLISQYTVVGASGFHN